MIILNNLFLNLLTNILKYFNKYCFIYETILLLKICLTSGYQYIFLTFFN